MRTSPQHFTFIIIMELNLKILGNIDNITDLSNPGSNLNKILFGFITIGSLRNSINIDCKDNLF